MPPLALFSIFFLLLFMPAEAFSNSCVNHNHSIVQGARSICERDREEVKQAIEFAKEKKGKFQKAATEFSKNSNVGEGQSGMFRSLEQRSAQIAESIYTQEDKEKFRKENEKIQRAIKNSESSIGQLEKMKLERNYRLRSESDPNESEKLKTEIQAIDKAIYDHKETFKHANKSSKFIESTEKELQNAKSQFLAKSKEMGARAISLENGNSLAGSEGGKTILASPNGETFNGKPTMKLQEAVNQAKPGDTIQLTPGTYKEPVGINSKRDLTIQGMKDANGNPLAKFDGGKTPENIRYTEVIKDGKVQKYVVPNENDFAMFKVKDSNGVTIKDVEIKNSWPNGIYIQDSQKTTIDGVKVTGSTNAVYAKSTNGNMGPLATKDITIQNSSWNQDPSGKIWTTNDWNEMHHGNQAYYNGAFLGGQNVQGNVLVENNTVTNAFNGVRLTCRNSIASSCNQNVTIQNNSFSKIRDNVVEPEDFATNWAVNNNTITDAHAPFSFDGVSGNVEIVGNTVTTTDRPSLLASGRTPATAGMDIQLASATQNPADFHDSGKVFKFDSSPQNLDIAVKNNNFDLQFSDGTRKSLCKGSSPSNIQWIGNTCTGGCDSIPACK
jgi:hypothetical protein